MNHAQIRNFSSAIISQECVEIINQIYKRWLINIDVGIGGRITTIVSTHSWERIVKSNNEFERDL